MGNKNTKSSLRNAIIHLNISADEIGINDEKFWSQIFTEDMSVADYVIKNTSVQEIRMLRDGSPKNFATLAYKMVERLCLTTGGLCNTNSQQTAVLNAIRILTRMLPCMFEDEQWTGFMSYNVLEESPQTIPTLKFPQKKNNERNYAAYLPPAVGSRSGTPVDMHREESNRQSRETTQVGDLLQDVQMYSSAMSDDQTYDKRMERNEKSLMKTLILCICDLLFCPEFTVLPHGDSYLANAVDVPPEDLKSLSTYDYVWEPGVGFDSNVNSTTYYDKNRSELLRTILVCLSATLYQAPNDSIGRRNEWIEIFVSQDNRHALPLLTSLLNVIFGYKPPRTVLQLNNLLFESDRERLVELSCQLLMAALDYTHNDQNNQVNLFVEYMSRIHREEDFVFLIKGFISLMNSGLEQGYLWTPTRYIEVDQELQMLLWKLINLNKKFSQYLLASNELLEIVVPILYHLNENFQETSKTALIHIGVFNLLVLSGERNFGVRLNKPYTTNLLTNLPQFNGSHADLMIVVFHKLIMYGYQISQLYDYLLTVLVNVSPYLKGTTILACKCMLQLFETFSSVMVIFTEPNYHQLVISLLEVFNNLIQYQFDGNANLVYVILNKKDIFINLANIPTSQKFIDKVLRKLFKQKRCMDQANATTNASTYATEQSDILTMDKTNTTPFCGTDDLDLSLAIVSCTNSVVKIGSETRRQEVSLVATPDIHYTTHPIHPFETDIDEDPTPSGKAWPNHEEALSPEPKIGVEDFLMDAAVGHDSDLKSAGSDPPQSVSPNQCERHVHDIDLLCRELDSKIVSGEASHIDRTIVSQASYVAEHSDHRWGDKWHPTSDWLRAWRQTLPLSTILRMICALGPQVEQFKRMKGTKSTSSDETEIIKYLQSGTLVGLLPVPHPIQIRKYRTNTRSTMWFRAYTWGIIYVRSSTWIGTDIRLINIL